MTVARVLEGEGAGALRWGACLLLVLGLHAGLVLALLRRAPAPEPPVLAPDAVMLELAPAAPPAQEAPPQPAVPPLPSPEPPPPVEQPPVEQPPVEPSPVEPPPIEHPPPLEPPQPDPAVALPEPPLPPPPPAPKRPPRPARPPHPAQASPPLQAPEMPATGAPLAPAPAPAAAAAAAPPASAFPGWRSELIGQLQRAKRYPDMARARDEQGTAAVAFTIDRSGHVLSARLIRSSGSEILDEEALAMVRRADPLPPMPAELPGSMLTFNVPVTFSLR